jgi:hypothetical protein
MHFPGGLMRSPSVQLAAMVLAFALAVPAQSIKAQTGQWIAAWGTSQEVYGSTTVSNRTIRMFARVAIGGQALRIRLDNTFSPAR